MNVSQHSTLQDQMEQTRTRTVRNILLLGIGILVGVALFTRVRTAIGMRAGDQTTIDKKRTFNKRWNNHLTTTVGRAGQLHSIFAIIHHVGRRSGKPYSTPVRVVPVEEGFIIPLTYGTKADWYRNLQVNAGGQIEWQGKTYNVGQAEIIDSEQALPAFPLPSRFMFWLDGVPQFVHVSKVS